MRFLIKLNVYINQITSPLHLCLKWIKISLSFFSDGGQHACLLFRRSEFKSRLSVQFFLLNLFLKRTKINKKRPGWPTCFTLVRAAYILPQYQLKLFGFKSDIEIS